MQQYPYNNFYQIVEKNAQDYADKAFIYDGDLKINGTEFKNYVDIIANYLKHSGIKPKDKVALVMINCWQFIINLFAISKIGAIIVPINNFLKEDEIVYILNDSQAKLLFSSAKFAKDTKDVLSKCNIDRIIWIQECPIENEKNIDYKKLLTQKWNNGQPYSGQLDEVALIVYTSGTTGKPKGAMLSFRNIFSNCLGALKLMKVQNTQAQMICYLPMFHAFTLTVTVLLPLYANSSIIVVSSVSNKKDFKYVLKQLLLRRCRYFTGIPDIYNAMSKAKIPWYFRWFHNVTGFISGASALSEEVMYRFAKTFTRGVLLQGYGISECSPVVSCNTPDNNKIGSVGKPLEGYQVKIFDEQMQEVLIGEIGEICVKGECVMQGYYNREAETKEAIVNGEWFKTGDIGRVDHEGYIYIIDRKKDIVIHKGMNIYPREIEEILYTFGKINACAIVGLQDKACGEVPIAYIELKEDQESSEAEIREFLKPLLAAFKVPKRVYFIDHLPRNATGKVLKRQLRDMCNATTVIK